MELTPDQLAWLQSVKESRKYRKIDRYYPETGPLRRELYPRHMEAFAAGVKYRERAVIASNRSGKSEGIGAYEATCHLTGQYPAWWNGHRFKGPVVLWACGDTAQTVRDSIQAKLLGKPGKLGTGMIPRDSLEGKPKAKAGIAEAVDFTQVRHVSGGSSTLFFKAYATSREAFQATEADFIWLDEECPMDVYTECLTRTATTNGKILLTFTPLSGLTDVVLAFWNEAERAPSKWMVTIPWADVPHLDEATKAELLKSFPLHQRDARTKGIPLLGAGAIYPVAIETLLVDDFKIPDHWARGYGLDVGWNRTAAVWGALDRDSDTLHLYSEHYRGDAEPATHIAAIAARGSMKGWIDPAARGRSQVDGRKLIDQYRGAGLKVEFAKNAVEAGIHACVTRMQEGRLKVFRSLTNWQNEFATYHRNEKGVVVKNFDHLMDATRYLVMSAAEMGYAKGNMLEETVPAYSMGGWMH